MKKYFLLIPLVLFSCKKESAVTESSEANDSAVVIENVDSAVVENAKEDFLQIKDSIINNAPATKKVLRDGVMREETKKEIIRQADVSMLPFNVGEEFKEDNQQFILKISDYDKPNIVAEISADKGMNIRFNQVKFADGTYDGPFGQTLSIPNKGKGEIWLIIGKSNMASGESKGRFSVKVE